MSLLAAEIRDALSEIADPGRAPGMAAYMKVDQQGGLGFLGIRRPDVRRTALGLARSADPALKQSAVLDLWENATYREERYAAQDVLALPWSRGRLDLLDLHEQMVLTGAWWDHVDGVSGRIADLVATHPEPMRDTLLHWSTAESLWLRRIAIIGQLGLRDQIDLDLLGTVITANAGDPEFFIRKGIGWALRDAARTHPDWVRRFVAATALSPLSRREALKHLDAPGSGGQPSTV